MAMQIIYSAGTASPTSPRGSPLPSPRHPKSPRSPRHLNYYEGWRPVMPGYKAPPPASHHPPTVVIQRTVEVQHLTDASDNNLKDSIPDMPKALAVTCLICNILIPGLGKWRFFFLLFLKKKLTFVFTGLQIKLKVTQHAA